MAREGKARVPRPALAEIAWPRVVAVNATLCENNGMASGPSGGSHAKAEELWEFGRVAHLDLRAAARLCAECARLEPFLALNAETFAEMATLAAGDVAESLAPERAKALRSILRHYVLGTLGDSEVDLVFKRL